MNGFFRIYETVEAKTKPLDSIAATLSNSIFSANSTILSLVYLKASAFLIRVVMSLNKIPFLDNQVLILYV